MRNSKCSNSLDSQTPSRYTLGSNLDSLKRRKTKLCRISAISMRLQRVTRYCVWKILVRFFYSTQRQKRSVSKHSTSLANFDPMRHRKESEKPFGRSDARINTDEVRASHQVVNGIGFRFWKTIWAHFPVEIDMGNTIWLPVSCRGSISGEPQKDLVEVTLRKK